MKILGLALALTGFAAGVLWWIISIVVWWVNFSLPFQLAGFFLIPNLALPWVVDASHELGRWGVVNSPAWLAWGFGASFLTALGVGLLDPDLE